MRINIHSSIKRKENGVTLENREAGMILWVERRSFTSRLIETFSTFSSVTFYAQVCRWSILCLLPLIYDNTKRCSKMHMLHYMTNGIFFNYLSQWCCLNQNINLYPGDVLYISLFWYDVLRHYLAENMISLFAQRQILCFMATKYLLMSPRQRKVEF